jgi:pilus assembly protein CpaB
MVHAKKYNFKVMILSLVITIIAVVLINRSTREHTEEYRDLISILVADEGIPKGTVLDPHMVTRKNIPAEFFSESYVRASDLEKIIALRTTVDILKNEPLSRQYFSAEMIEMGLSSKIPENHRAISVNVSTVSGLAGMLQPNDRVDVIGTFDVTFKSGRKEVITRILLQNISILAVGNVTSDEYIIEQSKFGAGSLRGRQYNTLTLKVTPEEAELLTFADRYGELRFILRRWDDENILTDVRKIDFDTFFGKEPPAEANRMKTSPERRIIHYEK